HHRRYEQPEPAAQANERRQPPPTQSRGVLACLREAIARDRCREPAGETKSKTDCRRSKQARQWRRRSQAENSPVDESGDRQSQKKRAQPDRGEIAGAYQGAPAVKALPDQAQGRAEFHLLASPPNDQGAKCTTEGLQQRKHGAQAQIEVEP